MSSLNLKFSKNKIKLAVKKCDLSCCYYLTIHPFSVGWDIMGNEPDPLPSYRELINRSYTTKFKDFLLWVKILHLPHSGPTTS